MTGPGGEAPRGRWLADREGGCWIDLPGDEIERLHELAERFGLHELAVEDACHAHQRPKLERFGDTLLVVAKPAVYDDEREQVRIGELLVIVGDDFVVSVRHGVATEVLGARHEVSEEPLGRARPIEVLYRLLDDVVDAYAPILEGVREDVAEIEHDVFSPERTNPAARIYALKRQVLDLLRDVEPLVAPLDDLTGGVELGPDARELEAYFRDVADHARRLTAQLRSLGDTLSDVLQANLAQVSVVQNDDMRRMSAWAAIFLVPTLMAGIWGMNFDHMPELGLAVGYPLALASMVVVSSVLWWQFRRIGWLGRRR